MAQKGLLALSAPAQRGLLGSLQDGLGGFGAKLNEMQQTNPEAFLALGAGLLQGDMGLGVAGMGDAIGAFRQDQRRTALQREGWDRDERMQLAGWDRDDARQARTFARQDLLLNEERAQRRALQTTTARFLEAQGAPPEVVQLAEAGNGQTALDYWTKTRSGGLADAPSSIQEIEHRRRLAPQYSLDPETPEGRAFVLTGKLPGTERTVTAGDRQAIRDADDAVRAGEEAGLTLDRALELSGGAMEGATAGGRAFLGNNVPDWLLPDSIASPEDAAGTTLLDQTVTQGALEQLKSIFGGNPTEGERKILLDIQGSSSKPKAVREEIYRRAKEAVARRQQFNRERAEELRGGTYYDPGRSTPAGRRAETPATLDLSAVSDDDLEAIANGR